MRVDGVRGALGFDGDAVRESIVPLLTDAPRLARMTEAAGRVGTRTGTENVIAMVDGVLRA